MRVYVFANSSIKLQIYIFLYADFSKKPIKPIFINLYGFIVCIGVNRTDLKVIAHLVQGRHFCIYLHILKAILDEIT